MKQILPLSLPKEPNQPDNTLISDFWLPAQKIKFYCFKSPSYGSHRKLIQQLNPFFPEDTQVISIEPVLLITLLCFPHSQRGLWILRSSPATTPGFPCAFNENDYCILGAKPFNIPHLLQYSCVCFTSCQITMPIKINMLQLP